MTQEPLRSVVKRTNKQGCEGLGKGSLGAVYGVGWRKTLWLLVRLGDIAAAIKFL